MGTLSVNNLGKAYKFYPSRWSRLSEWLLPVGKSRCDHKWILRDVSFSVSSGEAIGVVGANGAGKSTLLKMLAGTTQPTTGTVDINGTVAALLELGMGFHPDFTGRQNAFMAGQILGMDTGEISGLMPEIEAFAEIGEYFDQPLRVYSSGMSVRLAFAVATAKRPDILIVDEALSVGDAYFQHKSFRRIRSFQKLGTTLLLVSHDTSAIRSLCNRTLWLADGRVRLLGHTKEVVDAYSASLYERQQDISDAAKGVNGGGAVDEPRDTLQWKKDFRQNFIVTSNVRNDIQIFACGDGCGNWGDGSAKILNVSLCDTDGNPLSWMVGGEEVLLKIEAMSVRDLKGVIVGFLFRDRLGQALFGDNTYLSTIDSLVEAASGAKLVALFRFILPILPRGSYSIDAAVATGTQDEHVICDWMHQSIMLESQNFLSVSGLVGIPMQNVELIVEGK